MRRMKIYFHAPRQFFVLDPLFKMQRKRDNAEGSEDGGEEDEGEERRSRMKARSAAFDLQDGRGARDEAPVCACCMGVVGSPPERLEEMRTEEMAEEEKRMEQQRGCEGAREQRRPRALERLLRELRESPERPRGMNMPAPFLSVEELGATEAL